MIGTTLVLLLLVAVCLGAIRYPPIAVIGLYGFLLLDPIWVWRWAMPQGIQLQKFIVAAMLLGYVFSGFRTEPQSRISKWAIGLVFAFYGLCWLSTLQSVSPVDSHFFMSVVWKQLLVLVMAILLLDSPKSLRWLLIVAVIGQGYNAFEINLDYFQTGVSRYAAVGWGSMGFDNNGYSILTMPVFGTAIALAFFEEKTHTKLFSLESRCCKLTKSCYLNQEVACSP